jgi:hypothetical protein
MGGYAQSIAKQELWSSVGYWILVGGLIGDILVLVVPAHRQRLEKVLTALFTIIIIVGVAVEHGGDKAVSLLISQEELEFDKDVADAKSEAAKANERASRNEKDAERERSARVRLEKLIQPRVLIDPKQRASAVSTLGSFAPHFAGTKPAISSILDSEAEVFALDIFDILADAGIKADTQDIGSFLQVRGAPVFGLQMTGPPTDVDFMKAFGLVVCKPIGTDCRGEYSPKYKELKIEVDFKPIPGVTIGPPRK